MLIDAILLAIIFCGIYFGYQFGVGKWLFYLISIFISVWVTLRGSAWILNRIELLSGARPDLLIPVAVFVVLGLWLFVCWWIWNLLEPYYSGQSKSWTSPLITSLMGAIGFTLTFACVLVFAQSSGLISAKMVDESYLAKPLLVTAEQTIMAVKGTADWNEQLKGISEEVFEKNN